jgi:hypothetical protein
MANNYTQFSQAIEDITDEEDAWITTQLDPDLSPGKREWDPEDANDAPDFQWDVKREIEESNVSGMPKGPGARWLWIYAEEFGNLANVATFVQAFLKKFRPSDCFTMTWSETCSRLRTGEFSGGAIFVTARGTRWLNPWMWLEDLAKKYKTMQLLKAAKKKAKAKTSPREKSAKTLARKESNQ